MNKDELLGFFSQLLQQGNPFQHMAAKPIEEVEQSQGKRLARAGLKGATFGLTNQNFENQNWLETGAEFVGSIPSTVAATAGIGAIPGVAGRLATLAPTARKIATAGLTGGAIGAGKAIVNQDPQALITDPLWWMLGEGVGVGAAKGFGAIFKKLRSSGATIKEATEQAEKEILQSQALARRPLGPDDEIRFSAAGPVGPTPKGLPGRTIDAEEVTNLRTNILEQGAIRQPESSFFRSPEAYTSPQVQEMDEVTKLIQRDSLATDVDVVLGAQPRQIPQPLREPLVFEKETGPKPRFVKDAGSFRNIDEFGTDLEPGFYGTPRRMDEFGIEDVDNLPSIDTFSHGILDDPRDISKKLLKTEIDPKTGAKIYTPLDQQTAQVIESVGLLPREIEPKLDAFQRKAVTSPKNQEKLDLIKKNQNLTTTKLLELSDDELANLKDDFVIQPAKFFTVEDAPLAQEAKKLITKMGFSQDDIIEMEGMVDDMMGKIKTAEINKNLPEVEWQRARQQLWEDLLKKRMRPC